MQEVDFVNNLDYYITSLNCNILLENTIHKKDYNNNRKKLIEELSQKSRFLLEKATEKGTAYQNDIGWLTSYISLPFNFYELAGNTITLFFIQKY